MPWIYKDISENLIFYTSDSKGDTIPCKGTAVQKIWVSESSSEASEAEEESGSREEETQRRAPVLKVIERLISRISRKRGHRSHKPRKRRY